MWIFINTTILWVIVLQFMESKTKSDIVWSTLGMVYMIILVALQIIVKEM